MFAFANYASAPAHKLLCDQRNDYFVQSAACPASITQSAGDTRQRI